MYFDRLVHAGRTLAAVSALAFAAACDDSVGPEQPPAAPATVTVAANGALGSRVTWTPVSGVDGYLIQRAAGTSGAFADIATPAATATSYDDTGLTEGTTYRYRVLARRGTLRSAPSSEATLAVGFRVRTLTGNITANETWSADTTYVLRGFVKVLAPATLTIAAGTKIVGDSSVAGSALFILQGAKINAQGTATSPIVFTSQRAVGVRQPGDWGGLVIVGRGRTNRSGRVVLEGTTATPSDEVVYSGGTDNADDSGIMSYVRVEFAGYPVLPNAELNSFTLAAVGSATRLSHLQAVAGLDDSFEWFGGAVDAKYLVSYEAGDDHFDASEGYVGRNQFLIAFQDTVLRARAGLAGGPSNDPQAFEVDGCDGTGCDLGRASVPYNMPVFANFTVVGTGSATISGQGGGVGMVLRRGTGGTYVNGVVARFPGRAISIRDAFTDTLLQRDSLVLRNLLLADNAANLEPAGTNFGQGTKFAGSGIDSTSAATATLFTAFTANPASAAALDWTPSAGSPLRTGGLATFTGVTAARAGTFVTATSYRGAADPNGPKWWAGWTIYARR